MKPKDSLEEAELIKETERYIKSLKKLLEMSGYDACFVCGMRPKPLEMLLDALKRTRRETIEECLSVLPRFKVIDKKFSTDMQRYPHGFNQSVSQIKQNINKIK
jgi:hypothetical protein